MGICYYLYNDTKGEVVHYEHMVKKGSILQNEQVQLGLLGYMLDNDGDSMRFLPDCGDVPEDYKEVDLSIED